MQVRTRLSAGGNWIRTSGSARDSVRFSWSRCLASASSRRPPKGCGVRSTPLSFFSLTRERETKKIKAEKYSEAFERRIVAETQEPWGINVSEARLCIAVDPKMNLVTFSSADVFTSVIAAIIPTLPWAANYRYLFINRPPAERSAEPFGHFPMESRSRCPGIFR
jgi:hypothetical protein